MNKEILTQAALGTYDQRWLTPSFILQQRDPEILRALSKIWEVARIPKDVQILLADTLIAHPNIPSDSREQVLHLRNTIVEIDQCLRASIRKSG